VRTFESHSEADTGAVKTTLVRGLVEALGHHGSTRSPTFNLLQVFDTVPPVLHADLYRVGSSEGLGIEDYLDTHVVLIEWPDRAAGLTNDPWQIHIETEGGLERVISVRRPGE
jgi:tRNA threonylcarbamoyladenosine biosynthesis protein TsaE